MIAFFVLIIFCINVISFYISCVFWLNAIIDHMTCHKDYGVEQQGKKHLPSVSASLVLAAGIGIAEAVALSFGSGFLMNIMGVPVVSPTFPILFCVSGIVNSLSKFNLCYS